MNDVIPPPFKAVLPSPADIKPALLKSPVSSSLITTKKISVSEWHDYFQIWYLISGEYIHTMNNRKYILKPGDAVIIPPYMVHESDLSISDMAKLRLIRIIIHNKAIISDSFPLFPISYQDVIFKNTQLPELVNFSESEKVVADGIVEKILTESDRKQVASLNKQLALISDFLDLYAARSEKHFSQDKLMKNISRMQLMEATVSYISFNWRDRKLSIDDIAAHVNMSRRGLTSTFYELIGRTVHDYIIATRLLHAQIFVRSSTMSISEVSKNCGFASNSHFTSCFKRVFGCTPLQFRRKYSDWQIKYGDTLYKNDVNLMKWFFEPDEAALIRHWTSMNYIKNSHSKNS